MKLNVQDELQRFIAWQADSPPVADSDLLHLLGVITGYLRTLSTGNLQVTRDLRENGSQLAAELNRLMAQSASTQEDGQSSANKDNVLYAVYDRIESLLIVAKANRDRNEMEIYQQLIDYLNTVYAQELQWIRIESLGRTYNPYEFDGFVADRSRDNRTAALPAMVIRKELRAGFTCRGKVIRKPVVEFLE
jgi:molecular chaperone GrpE (heat shock protein)